MQVSTDGQAATPAVRPSGERAAATDARVLFDVNHPAQVHLFRHVHRTLADRGAATMVASREKDVTVALLDAYDIDHEALTARSGTVPGLVRELVAREARLARLARRFDPDVIVSRLSPAAAHVATLCRVPNVVVSDTAPDPALLRRAYQAVTWPFVDRVCAPASFDLPIEDGRRRSLDYQELAYLHPRYFSPDPEVLATVGIDADQPYFVLRLAGWDAYHDVGHQGLSPETARELVGFLEAHGDVYISAEGDLPPDLADHRLPTPPEHVHQVLYFADLYVGDSGTMSTEAAVLGTPAVRTNSMVGEGDENVFRELENRYGLLQSYAREEDALAAVADLLDGGLAETDWRGRRERLLAEQPDPTASMVEEIVAAAGTE